MEKEIKNKRNAIESKGGIVCDNFDICHNRATRNIQNAIIEWVVKANGDYSKTPIYINADDNIINEHLCDDCRSETSY